MTKPDVILEKAFCLQSGEWTGWGGKVMQIAAMMVQHCLW